MPRPQTKACLCGMVRCSLLIFRVVAPSRAHRNGGAISPGSEESGKDGDGGGGVMHYMMNSNSSQVRSTAFTRCISH